MNINSVPLNFQSELVSGTNIKTINSNSLLGSGDLIVGGGGVHILTKPISNRQYNVRLNGTPQYTYSSTTNNQINLYPFIPLNSLTIKNLQLNVSVGVTGALVRILIYSDLNGVPYSKLLESTSLDASTTGVKTYTASFTFTAGTTYWLGIHSSLNASIIIIDKNQMMTISVPDVYSNNTCVTTTITFPLAPATLGTTTPSTTYSFAVNLTAT